MGKNAMRHIFLVLFPRECRVRLCAVLVSFGNQYTATERLSPQGRRHSCDKNTVVNRNKERQYVGEGLDYNWQSGGVG